MVRSAQLPLFVEQLPIVTAEEVTASDFSATALRETPGAQISNPLIRESEGSQLHSPRFTSENQMTARAISRARY
jgi:hypothetical protein